MMESAVVLFVHHKNDAITRIHRDLLRMHNDFPIVPLFCDDGLNGTPLDDAVHVEKTYSIGTNWHNVDWVCRDWFIGSDRIDAEKYIWLDWDCHVSAPLCQWYGPTWSKDFVATRPKQPDASWSWMRKQRHLLPPSLQSHATGISPLNGVLLSRYAMEVYAGEELPEGIFSELRLPTVLASQDIHVSEVPPENAETNRYFQIRDKSMKICGKGLFHPVKFL